MRTFVLVALVLFHVGCGKVQGPPKTIKVDGIVKYKGQPLDKGKVTLHPNVAAAPGGATQRPAIGEIQPGSGGKFTLSTFAPGDGAMPGSYKVTVESYDQEITMEEFNEGKREKSSIPEKFRTTQTSGLTATIPEQGSTYELTLDLMD